MTAYAEHFRMAHPVCPHCRLPTVPVNDPIFDDAAQIVLADVERIAMGPLCWALLTILRRRPGMVFSHNALHDRIYGNRAGANPQGVRYLVRTLRERLRGTPYRIKTIHGVGYALVLREKMTK